MTTLTPTLSQGRGGKRGKRLRVIPAAMMVAAGFGLAACNEIPQDAVKPYAGKEDTKAYAGDLFKGDKDKYEKHLAKRADYQNEYIRTGDAKSK